MPASILGTISLGGMAEANTEKVKENGEKGVCQDDVCFSA